MTAPSRRTGYSNAPAAQYGYAVMLGKKKPLNNTRNHYEWAHVGQGSRSRYEPLRVGLHRHTGQHVRHEVGVVEGPKATGGRASQQQRVPGAITQAMGHLQVRDNSLQVQVASEQQTEGVSLGLLAQVHVATAVCNAPCQQVQCETRPSSCNAPLTTATYRASTRGCRCRMGSACSWH